MDQEPETPVTTLDRLGRTGAYAALTFDDGPEPPWTEQLLDVIEKIGTPVTFFVLGCNIDGREDILKRMALLGCPVEIHGWDHSAMTQLPPARLAAELDRTRQAIRAATGRDPRYVRPPFGEVDAGVLGTIRDAGLVPAFWSVHAGDWTRPGVPAIEHAIISGLRAGTVALLHDGGGDRSQTVAAVPGIVAAARRRGLQTVCLPEPGEAFPVR